MVNNLSRNIPRVIRDARVARFCEWHLVRCCDVGIVVRRIPVVLRRHGIGRIDQDAQPLGERTGYE